jgi:hypothetical protein
MLPAVCYHAGTGWFVTASQQPQVQQPKGSHTGPVLDSKTSGLMPQTTHALTISTVTGRHSFQDAAAAQRAHA